MPQVNFLPWSWHCTFRAINFVCSCSRKEERISRNSSSNTIFIHVSKYLSRLVTRLTIADLFLLLQMAYMSPNYFSGKKWFPELRITSCVFTQLRIKLRLLSSGISTSERNIPPPSSGLKTERCSSETSALDNRTARFRNPKRPLS
jgi:hypothetical protein